MTQTVYIAGPMTGLPDWNYPAFHDAAAELRDYGFNVLNPAEHFDGATDRERSEYLRMALQAVVQADFIVLLPGWEDSEGVARELEAADAADIPAYDFFGYAAYLDILHGDYGIPVLPERITARPGTPPRAEVLEEASRLITGDRNNSYGPPDQDFVRTAAMWQAMGYRGPDGRDLRGSDVALLMIALKLSRATWQHKRDNFTDIAGYAGCGHEVSLHEREGGDR